MADDKHYIPGDFYRICDRTGFKVRAGKTQKEWNNLIVRGKSWEPRQPQDFVRGVVDDQTVPEARPRQTNVFIGPLGTFVSVAADAGDVAISVETTTRMQAGDFVSVMLDNGESFNTIIFSVLDSTSFQTTTPLPWSASVGNSVIDKTAYSQPDIG